MPAESSAPTHTVEWKDEGDWGRLTVTDLAAYRAWCEREGIDPDGLFIPFGSKPDGQTVIEPATRAQARKEARRLGVALKEW